MMRWKDKTGKVYKVGNNIHPKTEEVEKEASSLQKQNVNKVVVVAKKLRQVI